MKATALLFCVVPLVMASCCTNPDAPTPSMQFTQEASGCGDLFVYKSNATGTEYLLVELNREILGISTQSRTFDIATTANGLRVDIDTYSRKPHFARYCNDVLDSSDPSPETWNAKSGRVIVSISEDHPIMNMTYTATVRLEDVTFKSRNGEETFLKEATFTNVTVGWFPG